MDDGDVEVLRAKMEEGNGNSEGVLEDEIVEIVFPLPIIYRRWNTSVDFNYVGLRGDVWRIQYSNRESYVDGGVWQTSNLQGHFGFST